MSDRKDAPESVDVHSWFSLTYASYFVMPRSLLQSMPEWWQHRFTALMDELGEHFHDIELPRYEVRCRDAEGRYTKDPIPPYNRGRTFIPGTDDNPSPCIFEVARFHDDDGNWGYERVCVASGHNHSQEGAESDAPDTTEIAAHPTTVLAEHWQIQSRYRDGRWATHLNTHDTKEQAQESLAGWRDDDSWNHNEFRVIHVVTTVEDM